MPRPNPFQHAGLWYWYDEEERLSKAYGSQSAALKALLRHADRMDGGEAPWYIRLLEQIVEFWYDTRG